MNKLTVHEGKKQKGNPVTEEQPLANISHHDAAQLLPAGRACNAAFVHRVASDALSISKPTAEKTQISVS